MSPIFIAFPVLFNYALNCSSLQPCEKPIIAYIHLSYQQLRGTPTLWVLIPHIPFYTFTMYEVYKSTVDMIYSYMYLKHLYSHSSLMGKVSWHLPMGHMDGRKNKNTYNMVTWHNEKETMLVCRATWMRDALYWPWTQAHMWTKSEFTSHLAQSHAPMSQFLFLSTHVFMDLFSLTLCILIVDMVVKALRIVATHVNRPNKRSPPIGLWLTRVNFISWNYCPTYAA